MQCTTDTLHELGCICIKEHYMYASKEINAVCKIVQGKTIMMLICVLQTHTQFST